MIADGRSEIEELARSYTGAWCSRGAARVAAHYGAGGKITDGGEPAGRSLDQEEYDRRFREGAER